MPNKILTEQELTNIFRSFMVLNKIDPFLLEEFMKTDRDFISYDYKIKLKSTLQGKNKDKKVLNFQLKNLITKYKFDVAVTTKKVKEGMKIVSYEIIEDETIVINIVENYFSLKKA